MGQANQVYAKFKRILPNPMNPNELYLVLEKDKPMSEEIMKNFEERFRDKDIILTVTLLVRNKRKHTKLIRGKKKK